MQINYNNRRNNYTASQVNQRSKSSRVQIHNYSNYPSKKKKYKKKTTENN